MKKQVCVILATFSTALLLSVVGCGGNDDAPANTASTASTPSMPSAAASEITVSSLRLIGSQVIPSRSEFASTTMGGLSGIDYDPANKRFFLVSDDRTSTDSATAPCMCTQQN
jgi:hypothetical protein